MVQVAVAGASGYAGGELLRLLVNHPGVTIGALTANSSVGQSIAEHHPHLRPLADRILQPTDVETLSGHDVVFLALPHAASGGLAAELEQANPEVIIIDISADHRLLSAGAWEKFYGGEHLGSWPYGLPELPVSTTDGRGKQRDNLIGQKRFAVPGCYPTAISLALAPGVAAGLIETHDLVVVAASGTSGAGKALKPNLLGSEVMGSMSPYGVGGVHRHTPEVQQNLSLAGGLDPSGNAVSVSFTPTLAPMARGILATCTARLVTSVTPEQVRACWQQAYQNEPFVEVLPEGQWPRTADTLGANTVHLQLAVDETVGRVIVVAAVDNLTKGTAGAAVQCLNLAAGFAETAGLPTIGVAP